MAQRRMISKKVVDTDKFLDMPIGSRLLYYDFLIRADDDGFVANPKKITKITNATLDDFKILIAKEFIIPFETGVCVIKHWRVHNYIRSDRYTETEYIEELGSLQVVKGKYVTENVIPMVDKRLPQVRLGKVRLVKEDHTLDSVESIFACFVKNVKKDLKLTTPRRNLIKKKLNDGYTKDQIIKAIENFVNDGWCIKNGYCDLIYAIGQQKGKRDNLEHYLHLKTEGGEKWSEVKQL